MNGRNLIKAFVRVLAVWWITLLIIPGMTTLVIMGAVLHGEGLFTVAKNMEDIMFVSSIILMYSTWMFVPAWALLALLFGIVLFGLWIIDRFLPWRRWLKLELVNLTD